MPSAYAARSLAVRRAARAWRVFQSAATSWPMGWASTHALVSLLSSISSPPYRPQPEAAPHARSATSMSPSRLWLWKLKTSRIMRTSGMGCGLKKAAACAADAFAGTGGVT